MKGQTSNANQTNDESNLVKMLIDCDDILTCNCIHVSHGRDVQYQFFTLKKRSQ